MPSKLHHLSKLHLHPLPPQHYSPLLKPFLTAKGAHAPPPVRVPPEYSIMGFDYKPSFFLVFLLVSLHFVASSGLTDSEILLKFKDSLSNASALSDWSDKTTPCTKNNATNWVGVICVDGILWGLQLENMGLAGKIDLETLQAFPDLKTLSIMNNNFDGPMPEFKKIVSLRAVYLSNNHFSGVIPLDAFDGMLKLKKVYLAQNKFAGAIPSSLTALPKLLDLRLEDNQFTGQLPDLTQNLQSFSVSNNALEGPIPAGLSKMDSSSFSGNKGLCGPPLKECNTTTSNSDSKKPPVLRIVIIAAVVGLLLGAIVAAFLFLLRRRQRQPSASIEAPPPPIPSNLKKKTGFKEENQSPSSSPDSKKGEAPKLSFVRDDRERFDLPDLLKASAEILGSGCFGSSYRAALSSGTMMVVKRFKQMNNVGKEEFQEHMRRLGRLKHSNLLPLVAYYYRKEEKLLITDFVEKGNLAVHLHDHQALGLPSLDWPSRLKIVKGVASGLAYLYRDLPNIIAAHGHLKSSNVLLTQSNDPLLTDYGLVPVINQENAQELMVAYKSPEYLHHGRITKKTDVWSLGMLILEILTAKLPANFVPQGKGSEEELDLAKWASSVPREEWANVVIDKEMTGGPARQNGGGESEVIKLLKIGMSCCEADVEKRIDLKGAVERIEEIKERDGDDDFLSSYASEGDMRASIGKSDEITFS
ncbi:LEUCINE-RICH REPEAT RECEPTOR-LIKE PROTEIN KINASE PXC1 [Salix purpurea]|uniref:LEUCINE-RICH REPEAT RECEPTOR-LIKE PROTEIN KINASE PXC1 n=1 Tax=Salix purpurea TaxID=77065 RepID=A0A9Q0Q431_SALPP|nr:LEUCINE-RICH REPEAT RECEPTOR-LIKE PROTEIN KINASE PXC1 [Salix purpurea]